MSEAAYIEALEARLDALEARIEELERRCPSPPPVPQKPSPEALVERSSALIRAGWRPAQIARELGYASGSAWGEAYRRACSSLGCEALRPPGRGPGRPAGPLQAAREAREAARREEIMQALERGLEQGRPLELIAADLGLTPRSLRARAAQIRARWLEAP